MKSNKVVLALVFAMFLGAGFLLWRHFSGPAVNLKPSAAAGELLAEEVGRIAGSTGKVLIIARQASREGTDAMGTRVEAFAEACRQGKPLKLAGTEWVARPAGAMMDMGGVSSEQLQAALEKHGDATVTVVFAGLPPFSQALADRMAGRSLKLVAVCGYGPTVRHWLEAGALSLAVVPRLGDPPTDQPAPKTAREWFEREFQIVTPANVGQMPY